MAHQLGRPRKQQIGLHPVRGVALETVRVLIAQLDRLGTGAQAVVAEALGLGRRQEPSALQIAVSPIASDIFLRQHDLVPVHKTAARLNACPGGTGEIGTPGLWPPLNVSAGQQDTPLASYRYGHLRYELARSTAGRRRTATERAFSAPARRTRRFSRAGQA